MAFYDNKHWLLSHIRNSFVSSDDTGMCEMVMQGENLSRKLVPVTNCDCYPGEDDSDEDDMDAMAQSFDIQSDLDFGAHRARSNTAAWLEKMDREKKKAAKMKHVKWEGMPVALSDQEMASLFQAKDLRITETQSKNMKSLLAMQLEQCPQLPQNPFQQYAKFDGNAQVGVAVRKYGIFLPMLPSPACNYPLPVVVLASAKVQDLIGLICYKCTSYVPGIQHPKGGVEQYALHIAEDDGEVDWDFPCLDSRETVGKFGFKFLALVESKGASGSPHPHTEEKDETDSGPTQEPSGYHHHYLKAIFQEAELRMKGQMAAIGAHHYQSYRVFILHPLRVKTEIHLGISGDKVEIDPVTQQKVSAKFWVRQRAVSYDTDCIVDCFLTEAKSNNRALFRLVYYHSTSLSPNHGVAVHSSSFKHHDFEATEVVAKEVVQKITHILELRSSSRRKEYLAIWERKSNRRKNFHSAVTSQEITFLYAHSNH